MHKISQKMAKNLGTKRPGAILSPFLESRVKIDSLKQKCTVQA